MFVSFHGICSICYRLQADFLKILRTELRGGLRAKLLRDGAGCGL